MDPQKIIDNLVELRELAQDPRYSQAESERRLRNLDFIEGNVKELHRLRAQILHFRERAELITQQCAAMGADIEKRLKSMLE